MTSCGGGGRTGRLLPPRDDYDTSGGGGGGGGGIRLILRRSLEALLKRDEAFARAFLRDRCTFERFVKHLIAGQRLQQRQQQQQQRVERSAALHCIVLAFRLARIDDFTSEMSAPVLMAGALSGVIGYPYHSHSSPSAQDTAIDATMNDTDEAINTTSTNNNGHRHQAKNEWPSTLLSSAQELASHAVVYPLLEDIEDAAQSLLEILEHDPAFPVSEQVLGGKDGLVSKTSRTSAMISSNHGTTNDFTGATAANRGTNSGQASELDDPATCGTFTLRRLCLCGLGFSLHPPTVVKVATVAATAATEDKKKHHPEEAKGQNVALGANKSSRGVRSRGSNNVRSPRITNDLLETLVVLAHGRFLHPDAAALDQFLDHTQKANASKSNYHRCLDGKKQSHGGNPPPRERGSLSQPPGTPSATTDLRVTNRSVTDSREIGRRSIGRREACNDDDSLTSESSLEEGKTLHNRGQNGGLNVSPDVAPAAIAAAAAGTVRTKESRESDAAQHGKAASDGARAGRRGDGGGEGVVLVARGKGTCMACAGKPKSAERNSSRDAALRSVARLLLAQVDVAALEKARARAYGRARRAVERALLDDSGRAVGATSAATVKRVTYHAGRANEGGQGGEGTDGGGGVSIEVGRSETRRHRQGFVGPDVDRRRVCPSCGVLVLGHPLDTIHARCGGHGAGSHRREPEIAAATAAVAGEAGATEEGAAVAVGWGARRTGHGIGSDPVAQALGERALAVVAEQLGRVIKIRRHAYDTSVARLAEIQAQAKKAKEVKLDRTVDFHRRLAAAASEAHQEIESSALRRSLLHGSSGFSSSSSSSPSSVCFSRHHRESSRKSRGALHATEAAQQPGDDGDGGPELSTAGEEEEGERGSDGGGGGGSGVNCVRGGEERKQARGSARSGSSGELYRSLARGLDDTHSAILRSMRDDGLDARPYLDERRKAFHTAAEEGNNHPGVTLPDYGKRSSRVSGDVGATNKTASDDAGSSRSSRDGGGSNLGGDTADWESAATESSAGGRGPGRREWEGTGTGTGMGTGLGTRPGGTTGTRREKTNKSDEKTTAFVGLTAGTRGEEEGAVAGEVKVAETAAAATAVVAVCRDPEQLRLTNMRRAAKALRLEMENREALEEERGARRRARDRAVALRSERTAKMLAREEIGRRKAALDLLEEEKRAEREAGEASRMAAAAVEKKRQAKLRRKRDRERRQREAVEKERQDKEMARIARWNEEKRDQESKRRQAEEDAKREEEAERRSKLDALSREAERRRVRAEEKRLAIKTEGQVASARLKRGEFRYLRGKLVYSESKGALLSPAKQG